MKNPFENTRSHPRPCGKLCYHNFSSTCIMKIHNLKSIEAADSEDDDTLLITILSSDKFRNELNKFVGKRSTDPNFMLWWEYLQMVKILLTVQITFIFIGQTRLVFGKCVCTCVTKHSKRISNFSELA